MYHFVSEQTPELRLSDEALVTQLMLALGVNGKWLYGQEMRAK